MSNKLKEDNNVNESKKTNYDYHDYDAIINHFRKGGVAGDSHRDAVERISHSLYGKNSSKDHKKHISKVIKHYTNAYNRELQLKDLVEQEKNKPMNESIYNAITNMIRGDLDTMRENFKASLTEKAIECLDERKREIAQGYFAQK